MTRSEASPWLSRLGDAAYVAVSGATVIAALRHDRETQRVVKPMMMQALGLAQGSGPRSSHDRLDNALLAVGLSAAGAGDVFMIDVDDDRALRSGAVCFAVMQGCWLARACRSGGVPTVTDAAPPVIAWAAAAVPIARRLPTVAPTLIGYGALLAATASATRAVGGRRAIGGALFLVSDSAVVLRRMVVAAGTSPSARAARVLEAFVLTTYAAAQYLLVRGATVR